MLRVWYAIIDDITILENIIQISKADYKSPGLYNCAIYNNKHY